VPSSMPTGSPPEPDDSRYRSDHVPRFANEEEAERWKRSMLDELRELHQGGHLQPASTPEETPPQGEPFRLIYQRLVPSVLPAERPRLRLVYAKGYEPGQVGPRSKTGDADCSAATSAWKSGRATPETHKQLAKCRAMTKTAKQATLQRAAGNEAKAQALEHRVASKGPLTAKARREEATKRVQERAGRNQSRAERQATAAEQTEQARVAAAGEPPPENHEEQARQAAVAAIRAHRARPSPETRVAAETAFAHHQEVSGGKDPFAPERPTPIPGSKPGTIGYEPDAFERDQMEHAARQAEARAQQPRTIKLRRPSPEHRAAVEATAEAIRARGEISRFAENGPGAVAVKAEEYRRKRADAQKAIGAARAAEPGSFPPRPYRSPLEGRQPETGAGLMGTAAPAHDPAHGLSWKMDVGDKRGYRTVHVDVGKVENSFARDEGSHVGPGGKGGIPGRYEEFQRFLHQARTEGTPIEQPRLALSESTGAVAFANGRHRFAVLRDMGAKTIPVTVPLRDARKIQERYGVKGTAAPAIGPRLSEQTAAHRATKGTPAERIARLREVAKGLTRRDFEAGALDRMNQRTDHLSALDRQITGTPELARRRRKAAPKEIRDLRFEEPTTAQRTGTLKRKKATTEASGLTPHERKVLEVLHAEPKGALTPTGDIKERAGIGHIAADRALLSLAEKGHINLHRHDFPHGMTEAEKRRAVVHGGVHYIGAALRSR
jgi:hypothetical protein